MRLTLPLLLSTAALAATITVSTPDNTFLNGKPVDATAIFVTQDGHLTVTLEDLQVNPRSVVQNLSDIGFVFADPLDLDTTFASGDLVSSSGQERTVAANGTYVNGGLVSTGWRLASDHDFSFGTGILIHLLGTPTAPKHTIIGPPGLAGYTNANASIAGNGPHNPFLFGPVTFEVNVPGLTADAVLRGVEFSFNTSCGYYVNVTPPPPPSPPVPEPRTFGLVGFALLFGMGVMRRAVLRH